MIQISETVLLKPISLDDVHDIFNTLNMERGYMRRWLPFVDSTMGEEDTFAFVQNIIEHNGIQYSIFDEGRFVGLIGLNNLDLLNKKAEIGYWLSQSAQGKGIMINSVKALIKIAFEDMSLNRLQIRVALNNAKSRRIPEKLGFKLEGVEREGELLIDNEFTDLAVYGLLKKEFNS
jgi:ribosomal-protein-serine acetyltransferase